VFAGVDQNAAIEVSACDIESAARKEIDQLSASLTCIRNSSQRRKERHGRLQEIGLSLINDLERGHIQHANRHCCYGCGATFVRATGVGTTRLERDFRT